MNEVVLGDIYTLEKYEITSIGIVPVSRNSVESGHNTEKAKENDFDDDEFDEGRPLVRLHKAKERNIDAVKKKKQAVLKKTGKLECVVCGFDFVDFYGEHGYGFAECHHIIPLHQLKEGHKTKLKDLAIVCANCHRMLHRSRPSTLTISQLKHLVLGKKQVSY